MFTVWTVCTFPLWLGWSSMCLVVAGAALQQTVITLCNYCGCTGLQGTLLHSWQKGLAADLTGMLVGGACPQPGCLWLLLVHWWGGLTPGTATWLIPLTYCRDAGGWVQLLQFQGWGCSREVPEGQKGWVRQVHRKTLGRGKRCGQSRYSIRTDSCSICSARVKEGRKNCACHPSYPKESSCKSPFSRTHSRSSQYVSLTRMIQLLFKLLLLFWVSDQSVQHTGPLRVDTHLPRSSSSPRVNPCWFPKSYIMRT